jgi:hypothetical protein
VVALLDDSSFGDIPLHTLKGEQRSELVLAAETAASLKEQYERWEQMVTLKQAADAEPACDRTAGGAASAQG